MLRGFCLDSCLWSGNWPPVHVMCQRAVHTVVVRAIVRNAVLDIFLHLACTMRTNANGELDMRCGARLRSSSRRVAWFFTDRLLFVPRVERVAGIHRSLKQECFG